MERKLRDTLNNILSDGKMIPDKEKDLSGIITPLQNYSSAKTSLPSNEPKGFKLINWQKGTVNLDLGGGKTTFGTDYLKKQGVKNLIYDFNYSAEHNKEIAEYVKENKVDTVTCFNVLNVLDTDAAIENMCLMAAKALKSDGTAYFQVYNKGSKGASQNNQSFQQGEPLSFYVPFVEKYFGKVKKTADLIIATKPIKTTKKSQWQFAFDSNEGLLFGVDNGKNLSGTHYKQLDITEYKFLYKDKEFIFKVGDTIIFKPKSENNQTEIKKIVCFEEQNAACKNGWAHEIWICWDDNTNEPVYSVAGTMYKTSLNEYDIVGYKAYNITLQELELQLAMNDEKLSGSGADENFIQDFQENIWKNGFNSVTLRQLDNIINDIQNGRVHIKTEISRRVARNYNRPRGSRNAYASAVICGREGRIYPKISSRNKEEYIKESERSDRYQKLLEEWAKSEGTQADIKTMNDPEYPAKNRYQLTIEQMLGGSGQHKETVSIYFYEDDDEEHPGNSVRSIRFVSVSYNFAAMKYHEEYLFSKSGVLEFVFANDYFDTGDYEYRFYCNSTGVINIITKHKGMGETKFTQEYSGAMNEDYTGIFNIYKTKAENYKKLFNAIEKTTNK